MFLLILGLVDLVRFMVQKYLLTNFQSLSESLLPVGALIFIIFLIISYMIYTYSNIVEETGRTSQYNDRVLTCNNLSERKQLMLDESDVFIALPGGVGTLDEVFTVAASYTIGYHHKRVILYNMLGFWDATIHMLDDLQQRGMIRGKWRDYICVASNIAELEALLN